MHFFPGPDDDPDDEEDSEVSDNETESESESESMSVADAYSKPDRSVYGPRQYPPRHRAILLRHKSSSDGVTIYDAEELEEGLEAWITTVPGVAKDRNELE